LIRNDFQGIWGALEEQFANESNIVLLSFCFLSTGKSVFLFD